MKTLMDIQMYWLTKWLPYNNKLQITTHLLPHTQLHIPLYRQILFQKEIQGIYKKLRLRIISK